jgi:hypothetical protein
MAAYLTPTGGVKILLVEMCFEVLCPFAKSPSCDERSSLVLHFEVISLFP